jgi:ketosteroid isomerase-like protein
MPHAIIREKNGRRHEVDFGDAAIRVEIHASDEIVEIFVEADFETHAEGSGCLRAVLRRISKGRTIARREIPQIRRLERDGTMKTLHARLVGGAVVLLLLALVLCPAAKADAQADIKTLEDRFVAAVKAKDLNAIMKVYVPDQTLFVFDVTPPRQYVGAAAYRKDWQEFIDGFNGPITFELTDLDITAADNLGYSHSIQRVAGTDKQGKKVDLTVRVTDIYKKVNGNWLVIHEHVSVPVDLDTGKPDLTSTP